MKLGFDTHGTGRSFMPSFKKNCFVKTTKQILSNKPVKYAALTALLAVPTLYTIYNSFSDKTATDAQGVVYIDDRQNLSDRDYYIDSIKPNEHRVQSGETLYSISKQYNVSVPDLIRANGVKNNTIYADQVLKIPAGINIKNIETIKDVSKLTGISVAYLKELEQIENPDDIREIYLDKNGNKTVGIGHKLSKDEVAKYEGRKISDEEKNTLLAEDIMKRENNIKQIINPEVYDNLPIPLKESVFDFVFHRGEGSFRRNKALIDGLNEGDYTKAVANLYMNYTLVSDGNGNMQEIHLAGLCVRSLIRMGNACKIFKNGIPDAVIESAKKTYEECINLLKQEFPDTKTYENVKAEIDNIAYNLFNGKIGAKTGVTTNTINSIPKDESGIKTPAPKPRVTGNTPVYVNGKKISKTKEEIEASWDATAKRYQRPFKRPELCLDKNGNVTAYMQKFNPQKSGVLSGKLIIVNSGHGGCSANADAPNNISFDPGCSNAVKVPVMGPNGKFKRDKKGQLILQESNVFIGNGGKPLEEWKINENFANALIAKLTDAGATVMFIQGEVHNAQKAIRTYEKNNKVDLFISLHSNSDETIKIGTDKNGREYVSERITPRGFLIMPNNRGGIDKEDSTLAKRILESFEQESWLKGLAKIKPKSLGVLSKSKKETSSTTSVLVETGNTNNIVDVSNLNSSNFQGQMVMAIYNGIVVYLLKK